MLQVWLLGQFEMKLDGRRVVLSARAAQSLLAYLILSAGTPHRREKLAGLLWSDLPDENARRNLRTEIWRIRKALVSPAAPNADYILADELTLAFNPNSEYWLDAAQLQKSETDPESLISSLSLYRGELLPGFYDDWISLERERLQAVFENKMQTLLETLIAAQRWNAVVEWGERWIAQGQTPEPAYRALMVAHNALGNKSQVALDYERCAEALRNDIGVEPSSETRALYEKLVRGDSGETQIASPLPTVLVQPAGTITFLFSDIEGSTKLLEKLGDEYAMLLSDQRDVLRGVAEKYSGYEVDTQGDSFFFAFFRAADAVNFAADAQRALNAHKWPHDATLRVRMGLHTGEPMLARTGYVGMDVHRAARIGASGHGGQVLLSQTTTALIENQLPDGTMLKDLGEHKLKDLRYPVHIIQLSIEGLPSDFPPLKAISRGIEPPAPGEPPFKGLEFFDERDANLFFGREQLTAKLAQEIRANQFLAVVVGASGSGKSSVVRAGLIPALKTTNDRGRKTNDEWRIYVMTPTEHPLEALATVLARDESLTATAALADDLAREPRSLYFWLRRRTNDERRMQTQSSVLIPHTLLVVDQFEELFTLCRDELEREQFIDSLVTALAQSPVNSRESIVTSSPLHPVTSSPLHPVTSSPLHPFTLVLSIRADFYAHLAQYPELRDAVAKHQEFIGPMNAEELRRAIEEPAKKEGWEFEPGLVDLILRDVGDEPGALPLLSHALLETWKRRSGHTLTLKGYHDAGGVRGAIAQTAEGVYQQFSSDEQAIVRDIFLRLTELGEGTEDTRRRASFQELMPHGENVATVHAILTRLADARLITLNQDSAEVAHEALIREWPQLREWLNQDREGLRLHRQITEAAQEWDALEHDAGALYRGARLIQARDFAEKHPFALNAHERAFLEASEENEKREASERDEQQQRELLAAQTLAAEQQRGARRLRWFAAGLALFLLLALGAAFFAFNQSNVAQNNFVTAERIRIASQAQIALDNGEGGDVPALLSLQSLKYGYSPDADAALVNALSRGFTRQLYLGHTDSIYDVDFSPDGRTMATASLDATARIWDVQTGRELKRFEPHARIVHAVEFSPDGRYLATGSPGTDGLRLWDIETGQEVRRFTGHVGGPWDLKFSPDGQSIVSGDDGMTHLWNVQTGEEVRRFVGDNGVAMLPYFSHDGRSIATGAGDGTVQLWDVATGQKQRRFNFGSPINIVLFTPDDKSVLVVYGKVAQLMDIQSGAEVRRFVGHTDLTAWGEFSPDGKYLVTTSQDKTARLWDVATGQELRRFIGHTSAVYPVAFSPNGKYVLTGSGDRTARLWDVSPEIEPHRVNTLDTSSDVFFGSGIAALSPDGEHVMNFANSAEERLKAVAIWETMSSGVHYVRPEITTVLHTISTLALSPDNRFLLGGGDDGVVWLWDAQTGRKLQELHGHTAPVRSVLFSPDGRLILSASEDKTARLWEVSSALNPSSQSGKELQLFLGHTEPVRAIAFSPDGKFVLTGSDDKTARLWDAQTGKELKQFIGHTAPLRAVNFSPDGKLIVTSGDDQTARIWNVETGKEIKELIGHTGQVSQAMFSPDGQFVLTGSADQTARLWNVSTALDTDSQTGQLVRELVGHVSPVLYIGFADNGRTIITGDSQNAYRWRASLDDVIAFTCSQLTRDLTDDERALYGIKDNAPTCAK